jgi:hypothetical protein
VGGWERKISYTASTAINSIGWKRPSRLVQQSHKVMAALALLPRSIRTLTSSVSIVEFRWAASNANTSVVVFSLSRVECAEGADSLDARPYLDRCKMCHSLPIEIIITLGEIVNIVTSRGENITSQTKYSLCNSM